MAESTRERVFGREAQLGQIVSAIDAPGSGVRMPVFVSGSAGMGKTSVVRAALSRSRGGALVAWGTCWHGAGAPGFWPWIQAFDDLLRSVGVDAAVDAAGRDRDLLSVLVRDLGPGPDSADPGWDRVLLLDAARRWLDSVAADRVVVLVLDDLQWADPSSLELLGQVIATPTRAQLTVIGAYRHDELTGEVRLRLAEMVARCDHVHLEGLGAEDVEKLVASIRGVELASEVARDLHLRTGGHPLFVRELARLSDVGGGSPLPSAVTGVVERRLALMPDETRRVLDVSSVLGNHLLPDVLAAVTGRSLSTIMELLDPAIQAGLLHVAATGEVRFSHDLFRETLYGALGFAARTTLHSQVGEALAARLASGAPGNPGEVAEHVAHAIAVDGSGTAVHWARRAAADERRRSAFEEAAAHIRRVRLAASNAGVPIEAATLVELLIEEADSQARSGDPDAARGLLGTAGRLAPDAGAQADVALAVQRLGAKFAAPRDAIITQLETALDAVSGVDIIREAQVTAALARELQHSVDEERARAGPLSEQALALGRQADDDQTLVACLLARHDALWEPGTGAQRAVLAQEIAAVGARLGDTDRLAEGLILEANGLLESGSAGFRRVLDRWFALLDTRAEPRDRYMVLTRRAALALLDGDSDAAGDLMHEAAHVGTSIHEPDTGNVLMSQRVALARVLDDPDELLRLAHDAVQWWTGAPVLAHAVAAGAYAGAGDLGSAAREIAIVTEAGGLTNEGSYLRSVLIGHLAEAAVALDDHVLCQELLDEIEPLAGDCGVNGAVVAFAGPFAYPAAILARTLGDEDRARRFAEKSLDNAQRLGARTWAELSEGLLAELDPPNGTGTPDERRSGTGNRAELTRNQGFWTISWRGEQATIPHLKGMNDIATLIRQRGTDVPALQLVSGILGTAAPMTDTIIDMQALTAYRGHLLDLDAEIDQAAEDSDRGRHEHLSNEREEILAEIRRAAGLGGQPRAAANDPAERARKSVSARIRDAVKRIEPLAPDLAAHLDRSIRTGLRCSYDPAPEDAVDWLTRDLTH
jgi:hypothetical protein